MILICILLSVVMLLSPMHAYAAELSDPIEPVPTFHGYEIQGYDELGNVVLSNDDYTDYINNRLADPIATVSDFGDLVESKTRFIDLPAWLDVALDMITYILDNPIVAHAPEETPSESDVEPSEQPEQPVTSVTYPGRIASVGKKLIEYSKSGLVETITCTMRLSTNVTSDMYYSSLITIERSGAGASSTFYLHNDSLTSGGVVFGASYYSVGGTWKYQMSNGNEGSRIIRIQMNGYSVNELPTTTSSSSTMLLNTDSSILGSNSKAAEYAENTFFTNDYEYNINHYNIYNTNNYWSPYTYMSSVTSSTTVTTNNYTDYSELGYYIDALGGLQMDMETLLAYITGELIPKLELGYTQHYEDYPEPGATYGESNEYQNPFETDLPDTLPSSPGGDIVVSGGMTPSELYGVLETDTYYILDMETGFPDMQIDSLPAVEDLPEEIVSAAAGVSGFVIDLFSSTGLLTIFMALVVLAFVVFAFHG